MDILMTALEWEETLDPKILGFLVRIQASSGHNSSFLGMEI